MAMLCGCRILVPNPEIEPEPSAVKMQNPNQWTCRGFPGSTGIIDYSLPMDLDL